MVEAWITAIATTGSVIVAIIEVFLRKSDSKNEYKKICKQIFFELERFMEWIDKNAIELTRLFSNIQSTSTTQDILTSNRIKIYNSSTLNFLQWEDKVMDMCVCLRDSEREEVIAFIEKIYRFRRVVDFLELELEEHKSKPFEEFCNIMRKEIPKQELQKLQLSFNCTIDEYFDKLVFNIQEDWKKVKIIILHTKKE